MNIVLIIIGVLCGVVIGYLLSKLSGSATISREKEATKEAEIKAATYLSENSRIKTELALLQEAKNKLQEQYNNELRSATEWKEKFASAANKLEDQKTELEQLQLKFTKEFQIVASKILEEKTDKFTHQNKKNLDELLSPLKERIVEFQKKVEESNEKDTARSSALMNQLELLRKLNTEITQETKSLTQALRGDSKTQGNWGEMQLESILEKAGLQKDIHYSKETNLKTDKGENQRLDYIVNLPDGKHLILDSKVSLTAYSNFIDAEDADSKKTSLKSHLDSIYNHIKLLSSKDYQNLYSINTPDYVMMFVANEPALTIALKEDQQLFEKALDKNIVIVSTSTLLATLRTISYIWKQDAQNKNADEIARQAAGLYDKFVSFTDDLTKVGSQLDTVKKTYDLSMKKLSSGKDNLIRKTERLRELGVNPSKQIDKNLLD